MAKIIDTPYGRMAIETYCSCGVAHAFPESLYDQAKQKRGPNGRWITCPNGHRWHYTGETEADRLRRERDRLKQEQARLEESEAFAWEARAAAERRTAAYKGQVTKLKRRASAGLCPCCNRTFQNLHRHMKTQHPDYGTEPDKGGLKVVEGGKS